MSKLLTPKELAEIKRLQLSDKFADEAERYYNDHVPDLLNHIEALNAAHTEDCLGLINQIKLRDKMRADSADWAAARDQYTDRLAEQYAACEVAFKKEHLKLWALTQTNAL